MMELRARFSLLDRLLGGLAPYDSLSRGITHLTNRFPRSWTALAVMAAAVGYAFILLFPYLLVSMAKGIYPSVLAALKSGDWLSLVPQVCVLFIGAVFTYTLFTLRFKPPAGMELTEDEAPRMFGLLTQLGKSYGRPRIHRVILDEGDDVRIIKTPRAGFPFLSTTTLVIGLPMLLTVSPRHFRVLVARRIGQISSRHNMLSGWLYHLKNIWLQYRDLRDADLLPARMIGHFFALYTPVFNMLMLGLSRRAEINADHYAHEIINEQEIVEAISFHTACKDYLASKYWPVIKRMAARTSGTPDYLPYEHMTAVVDRGLTAAAQKTAIQRLLHEDNLRSDQPALAERLENLGHSGPIPMNEPGGAAAQLLLEHSIDAILKHFNDRWLDVCAPGETGSNGPQALAAAGAAIDK